MNKYTVESPTLDTLADLYALHEEGTDVSALLAALRERLATGRTRLGDLLILRSARGVEGAVALPSAAGVPIFPRCRPDTSSEGVTALLRAVRGLSHPGGRLILDSTLAPQDEAAAGAAGWTLEERHVLYETDLRARAYPLDPQAVQGGAELLNRPDVQALLEQVGRAEDEPEEDWTLVALVEEGAVVALGATGSTPRPGREPVATVDLIGVLPGARGRGLGARLHAHLLALAAETCAEHAGATGADNAPMRHIFGKHGARLVAAQLVFRQR